MGLKFVTLGRGVPINDCLSRKIFNRKRSWEVCKYSENGFSIDKYTGQGIVFISKEQ